MRIGMIGLGALGGIYLDRIASGLPEADVFVVADGERADRLERDGVRINGRDLRFPIVRPGDEVAPADVLMIATKANGLEPAIELARCDGGSGARLRAGARAARLSRRAKAHERCERAMRESDRVRPRRQAPRGP